MSTSDEGPAPEPGPEPAPEAEAPEPVPAPKPEPAGPTFGQRIKGGLSKAPSAIWGLIKGLVPLVIILGTIGAVVVLVVLPKVTDSNKETVPAPKYDYRVAIGQHGELWGCFFANKRPVIRRATSGKKRRKRTITVVLRQVRSAPSATCNPEDARKAKTYQSKVTLTFSAKPAVTITHPGDAVISF